MEIKTLEKTNFEIIIKAFTQAFADYDVRLNAEELRAMWKRRGFNPGLSFAAFEGEDIVSFTLNGVGNFNGMKMAYDTGTGTLEEYRGRGLATEIFAYSIPYLKEANISYYLLEVLQHNIKAVSVYRNIGFEVTREFNYFMWNNEEINNEIKTIEIPCYIEKIEIEKYPLVSNFWDFFPSWQNSFESIQRTKESFISLGAFIEENFVGYCVFEPASGDITQIAVDKPYRRKGIASLLLYEIQKLNKNPKMKLINTDTSCNSVVDFLKSKNIEVLGKQFEMIKKV
ncbi:MAG TPA: GNAT family N-acetyltransferase [Ignavibacteriaceae bacterium]|jgi:ribosomal protein S18 acetylase RimI-like enzyme|nr:MAG: GNAT family N-acetyltransferase [Ignavibacteriales bacterium UTCHB2]HQF41592.1 GNAT family N-acetyltransferase [Ignavibacteriaceae bacterium]HQI40746.1 GNAT family N-acetyltransferase [Ignavibacteriaceae bacterium]